MSADNGIYILRTNLSENLYEYRVAHAQAIENIFWDDERDEIGDKLNPQITKDYFGFSQVFHSKDDALKEASKLYENMMQSDFPVVEYGIQTLYIEQEFPN
jgi:hypothetical protein